MTYVLHEPFCFMVETKTKLIFFTLGGRKNTPICLLNLDQGPSPFITLWGP